MKAPYNHAIFDGKINYLFRYNDRPAYNLTKHELAKMVADYMKDGCPPRCPKCQRGALRFRWVDIYDSLYVTPWQKIEIQMNIQEATQVIQCRKEWYLKQYYTGSQAWVSSISTIIL